MTMSLPLTRALRSASRLSRTQAYLPRMYATLSPYTPTPTAAYEVFDEPSKARQRDRALLRLRSKEGGGDASVVDYLREELAERLSERIEDLKEPPGSIMDLCSHAGLLTKVLQEVIGNDNKGKERKWWMVEPSGEALYRDRDFEHEPERIQASPSRLLADPKLNGLRDQVEAIVSAGGLHWVGDIVGALTQVKHLLKPDGVFVGAVLGGDSLFELRTSIQLAEQERRGGIANRVSPMINPTDAPSLLNRAGFTTTTVDVEDLTISYPSIWELMQDLRDMGESNAILGRRGWVSRDVLLAAEGIYKEMYGKEDGSVPATFQIIFMIGWKPGPNAPKPLERGSAQTNLKDILS